MMPHQSNAVVQHGPAAPIIYINGYPSVGKFEIAKELW